MPFVPAKCPSCGGVLKVDSNLDAAVCQFCGTPFIVEKAINNYTTNVHVGAGATVIVQGSLEMDQMMKAAYQFLDLGQYGVALEKFREVTSKYPSEAKGWIGMIRSYTSEFRKEFELNNVLAVYDSDYTDPIYKFENDSKPALNSWMSNAWRVQKDTSETSECQRKLNEYLAHMDQLKIRREACQGEIAELLRQSLEHKKYLQQQINPLRAALSEKDLNRIELSKKAKGSSSSLQLLTSLAVGGVILSVFIGWLLSLAVPGLGGKVFGICIGITAVLSFLGFVKDSKDKKQDDTIRQEIEQLTLQIQNAEQYNLNAHNAYNEQLLQAFCQRWGLNRTDVLNRKSQPRSMYTIESQLKY